MTLNPNKYSIKFFSVGEGVKCGDAILIELFTINDDSLVFLIDGGYRDTGEKICKELKKKYSNPRIDLMINTHPDKDHISGLISILEDTSIQVCSIIMNRPWRDSGFTAAHFKDRRITEQSLMERIRDAFSFADRVEEIAHERNIRIFPMFREIDLGLGYFSFLGPSRSLYRSHLLASDKTPESIFEEYNKPFIPHKTDEEEYDEYKEIEWYYDEQTSDINQTSLIIALSIGEEKFLFTGDAGKEAIKDALNYYNGQSYFHSSDDFTVVQLPHHGSRKNVDPDIIRRLSPKSYIISCSPEGEKEGHPSRRLINKILEIKPDSHIYVTKSSDFLFHKGVDVTCCAQQPQSKYNKMDGF